MFVDALLTLSDAQALTGTVAIVSTNTYDAGNPTVKRDIGVGEPVNLVVSVDVTPAGTTPTLQVELLQSANADLSSPDVIAGSGVLAAASYPAGTILELPVPAGRITKRYIGARYTQTGTTPTVTVTAFLQPQNMSSQAKPQHYAKGYAV